MKNQLKINIIDTLSYFDIFNYPLTIDELELFLHYDQANRRILKKIIKDIPIIGYKNGLYFFMGRRNIAIKRKIQEKENQRKLKIASRYIRYLSFVPGVKMITLTGSLAMKSASKDDDIDLLIITRKDTLWSTRFLTVLFAKLLGKKRDYKNKDYKDKLCLNMFMDENELKFTDRNLYIAHEIVQMKTYFDEGNLLDRFIKKNSWIKDYFPNISVSKRNKRAKRWFEFMFFSQRLTKYTNMLMFAFQYLYMSRRITKEKISLKRALFHPNDGSRFILNEHKKRKDFYLRMYESVSFRREIESRNNIFKNEKIRN